MKNLIRVIDTGVLTGRENMAIDAAQLELRAKNQIPDTLKFLNFSPSVLVGRHQDLSAEVQLGFCKENNIDIGRRITGGGAIYLDELQIGWELLVSRDRFKGLSLAGITGNICMAAASGLSKLGIDAKFRPRNDIEVDGKKISGTGGFFDGDILLFQGTVLIDLDVSKMANALNIPLSKASRAEGQSHEARVTTLKNLLAKAPDKEEVKSALIKGFEENLGFGFFKDEISQIEKNLAQKLYAKEYGTEEFVYEIDNTGARQDILSAHMATGGGQITALIRLEGVGSNRIREISFIGDFFIAPPRMIFDLESALRGVEIKNIETAVNEFFANNTGGMLSLIPLHFIQVINKALGQYEKS